ncbi:bleomycin resistance protein [Streptomyces sp. MUM 178J]|uniref:bleomycin resistance protein n=1 Tax=Streptomyces sp. MUM 178J TaxID=2791991 RepID=UPI001F033F20|nr:VOC family protein [Streptomyces sp. MUM 178J]WRQ82142.1 VOC family protein [Streptomyces sp. MUM 178J]
MSEKTIPLLPCQAIKPVTDFYTALGFQVTYRQTAPYAYAVVERGDIQLQFFGMKQYDPAASLSGCYVLTDGVDTLYESFRSGLKAAYGRIPRRGLPRIGPLKDMSYGMRQFLMTDPGGNSIRVGQPAGDDMSFRAAPKETFARALHMAELFADSKEDLPGAARILDRALARKDERPKPGQLVRLLLLRADIALRMYDDELAARLRARAAETDPSSPPPPE